MHGLSFQMHTAEKKCELALSHLACPVVALVPADLSAGEDDSEFYTPKASDMQQQGEWREAVMSCNW